jgi:tRNA(Ile2) C34 agmatinyltransferase TiaS
VGKALRVRGNDRLAQAVAEGVEFLIIGRRRFQLVEVEGEEPVEEVFYEPTDPEEIRVVEEALRDNSRVMEADEGRQYLKERLRQHGIG